mgnify:CR=1 FL=1
MKLDNRQRNLRLFREWQSLYVENQALGLVGAMEKNAQFKRLTRILIFNGFFSRMDIKKL